MNVFTYCIIYLYSFIAFLLLSLFKLIPLVDGYLNFDIYLLQIVFDKIINKRIKHKILAKIVC